MYAWVSLVIKLIATEPATPNPLGAPPKPAATAKMDPSALARTLTSPTFFSVALSMKACVILSWTLTVTAPAIPIAFFLFVEIATAPEIAKLAVLLEATTSTSIAFCRFASVTEATVSSLRTLTETLPETATPCFSPAGLPTGPASVSAANRFRVAPVRVPVIPSFGFFFSSLGSLVPEPATVMVTFDPSFVAITSVSPTAVIDVAFLLELLSVC